MLTGILAPTSRTGRVAGFNIQTERQQIKQAIGYMSQKFSLYEDLTVRENLAFFAGVYGATDLDWAIRVCRLEEVLHSICSSLSAGLRQRAALACAVVHRPRIVFLDEPTAGVDPASRRAFWELIYELAQSSVTVFVSTHYMDGTLRLAGAH
jgi:ABC-2 type transport system ATP-binding protein